MKRCLTRCKMFCLLTYNRYCFGHCLLDWYSCFWHRSNPEETFKLQKCFFSEAMCLSLCSKHTSKHWIRRT